MRYKVSDGITQSMLMEYLGCRQRTAYTQDGWELETSGAGNAMIQGNAFHYLLENFYQHGMFEPESALRGFMHREFPNVIDPEMIIATCATLFPHYVKFHALTDKQFHWDALEQEFDLEWNGYRLRGKIDGRFTKGAHDAWTIEHKTTSQFPDSQNTAHALSFSFQNFFYATALEALGISIVGTVQNYVRIPSFKTEDPKEMSDKIEESIKKNGHKYFFLRYPIVHSSPQKKLFKQQLLYLLKEYKEFSEGRIPCFRNHASCVTKYTCPFLSACATGTMGGYTQTRVFFRELSGK